MSPAAANPMAAVPVGGAGVPRHVAIIMDGNGRWAKKRRLPRVAGHRAGAEALRKTIRAAAEMGIGTLTVYAFSSENWRRPEEEISDLMGLLRLYLVRELDEVTKGGIRLKMIGDWRRLAPDIVEMIEGALARTAGNTQMEFVLALNYGAQDEIARAARALAEDVAAGRIEPGAIDVEAIEARLDTSGIPAPDLIIRTSGEQRLSNFLMWQAAYAELVFTDTLWPDFDAAALREAVSAFAARDRRYGGL